MNEAAFRELISGQKTGIAAGTVRAGLCALAPFYGGAVAVRNRLYDAGILRAHKAHAPVISVGNITTGGTGKTPCVAWLTHWFHSRNIRVAILSRGYHSLPGDVNDEKLVLDQLCPGVPHLQQPDRVASAERACREFGSQALILDDGFQHRRLHRDLDIVLIDGLNPFGYGHLLPRGLLREPLGRLKRADVVIITRANQIDSVARADILATLGRTRGGSDCVETTFVPTKLVNSQNESLPFTKLDGTAITAFCGIGNPDGFRRTLGEAGIDVAEKSWLTFPDHHHYNASDLKKISQAAKAAGSKAIVTTQKDLVKIAGTELAGIPLWGVRIEMKILAGENLLEDPLLDLSARIHG